MDNLILVNKDNKLDSSYVPDDLVIVNNTSKDHTYLDNSHIPMVRSEVLNHFEWLKRNAFVEKEFIFDIESGYRSFEYQNDIWFNKLKNNFDNEKHNNLTALKKAYYQTMKYVLLPGYSEHQTGLAIDLNSVRDGKLYDLSRNEIKWLYKNASKYGFILRYPQGKESITHINYEPWHYRYVGYPSSLNFYNGYWLTLEEYHELKLKKNQYN